MILVDRKCRPLSDEWRRRQRWSCVSVCVFALQGVTHISNQHWEEMKTWHLNVSPLPLGFQYGRLNGDSVPSFSSRSTLFQTPKFTKTLRLVLAKSPPLSFFYSLCQRHLTTVYGTIRLEQQSSWMFHSRLRVTRADCWLDVNTNSQNRHEKSMPSRHNQRCIKLDADGFIACCSLPRRTNQDNHLRLSAALVAWKARKFKDFSFPPFYFCII